MHSFSFGEIALIFGIVVILFGGSRLASIGKSLGEGISNFKKGLNGNEDQPAKKTEQQNTTAYTPPQMSAPSENVKTTQSNIIDIEQK